MNIRYRWFQLHIPKADRDQDSLFATYPFGSDTQFGFQALSSENGDYRFLWRDRVLVSTLDSEGLPAYQAVDSISFKDFSLFERDGTYFLRIENPGRNSRELFNALESLFGFGFSADAITFARSKPTLIFGSVDSSRLIGLKVSGAVVGEEVVARMEFVSKHGIDIAQITALKGLRYNVDFASFDIVHQGVKGNIAIFANGVVKIAGQLSPLLLDLLERELPALIQAS